MARMNRWTGVLVLSTIAGTVCHSLCNYEFALVAIAAAAVVYVVAGLLLVGIVRYVRLNAARMQA